MFDSWLNIGYEDDRLLPYKQPEQAVQTPLIGKLKSLCCIPPAASLCELFIIDQKITFVFSESNIFADIGSLFFKFLVIWHAPRLPGIVRQFIRIMFHFLLLDV